MKRLEGSIGLHGTSLEAVSVLMRTGTLPSGSSKEERNKGRIYLTLTDTSRKAFIELKKRMPVARNDLAGYFNGFYKAFHDVKDYAGFDHLYRESEKMLATAGISPSLTANAALWYTVKRIVREAGAERADWRENAFPEWLQLSERKKILPILPCLSGIRYRNRGFVIGFNEGILGMDIHPDPDTGK